MGSETTGSLALQKKHRAQPWGNPIHKAFNQKAITSRSQLTSERKESSTPFTKLILTTYVSMQSKNMEKFTHNTFGLKKLYLHKAKLKTKMTTTKRDS